MPLPFAVPSGPPALPPYHPVPPTRVRLTRAAGALGLLALVAFVIGGALVSFPAYLVALIAPLAVLALVIVWALPKGGTPPIRALSFTFFAVIAVLILWPNYLAFSIPGLPWITLLRLFGLPMFFLLLISLSISPAMRARIVEIVGAGRPIGRMLILFTILQCVSIVFSKTPGESLQKIVLFQIYGTGVFITGVILFVTPGRARRWAGIFTMCVVPICLICWREGQVQQVLWVGHIPGFLKIEDPIVASILSPHARSTTGIYRVQGTATTSLGTAEYLAYVTPFVIHYAISAKRLWIKLGCFALLPVIFKCIDLTDSRLGVVGYGMAILLFSLLWGITRWNRDRSSIFGPALTLAFPILLAVAIVSSFTVGRVRHMVWGDGTQQSSTDARKEQVRQGIPLILKRPLGYGPGRGGETLNYRNLGGYLTIDSWWLAVALDYGPAGLILLFGVFATGAWKAVAGAMRAEGDEEMLLRPAAITLVNFLIIKAIFAQDANHPMVFAVLGLIVALLYRQAERLRLRVPA